MSVTLTKPAVSATLRRISTVIALISASHILCRQYVLSLTRRTWDVPLPLPSVLTCPQGPRTARAPSSAIGIVSPCLCPFVRNWPELPSSVRAAVRISFAALAAYRARRPGATFADIGKSRAFSVVRDLSRIVAGRARVPDWAKGAGVVRGAGWPGRFVLCAPPAKETGGAEKAEKRPSLVLAKRHSI